MFNTTSYLLQNAAESSDRYGEEYRVNSAARRLYRQAREQARVSGLAARLTGRRPRRLAGLSAAVAGRAIAGRRYAGLRSVSLSQIRGSLDRTDEFDSAVRPVDERGEQRWLRVATARAEGRSLPPVQLIRLGNMYFIQDGHHRVSVAQARGEREIEAEVTDWQLQP